MATRRQTALDRPVRASRTSTGVRETRVEPATATTTVVITRSSPTHLDVVEAAAEDGVAVATEGRREDVTTVQWRQTALDRPVRASRTSTGVRETRVEPATATTTVITRSSPTHLDVVEAAAEDGVAVAAERRREDVTTVGETAATTKDIRTVTVAKATATNQQDQSTAAVVEAASRHRRTAAATRGCRS